MRSEFQTFKEQEVWKKKQIKQDTLNGDNDNNIIKTSFHQSPGPMTMKMITGRINSQFLGENKLSRALALLNLSTELEGLFLFLLAFY